MADVQITKSQLNTLQNIALNVATAKNLVVDGIILGAGVAIGSWILINLQKTGGDASKTISRMAQQAVGVLSEATIEIVGDIFEQIFNIFYKGGKKLGKKVDKAFKEAGKDIKKSNKKVAKEFDKFGKDLSHLFK